MENSKNSHYQLALSFHRLLQPEVYQGNNYLTTQMNQCIKEYYTNFLKHPKLIKFYEYNWATRVMSIIPFIKEQTAGIRILDAGCGVGTESLFFSSLNPNAEVIGVDIFSYCQAAQKRRLYWEQAVKKPLNVTFRREDIMDFVPEGLFDIIWVEEAISHIYTPDLFIQKMHKYLKKGGLIFVSDTNLLNPYIYYRILKMRGFKKAEFIESKDEETGKTMKVFDENILTISGIEKTLKKHNFTILQRNTHGFIPRSIFSYSNSISRKLDIFLSKLPMINLFGGIYTVVARKIS